MIHSLTAVSVRIASILVVSTLVACGGGGGGGGGSAPIASPPPPPKTISGVVLLGPVANADVEIQGTTGVLATGTTASDGSFGPIEYSGSYNGPLRVAVTGNGSSTWVCDFSLGCPAGDLGIAFGETADYEGTIEAVTANASDGDFVNISMLSDFVAKRVDVIGDLSAANVDRANLEVTDGLRLALQPILNDLAIELDNDIAATPLPDLTNLPEPTGTPEDLVGLTLSLVNSSFMGLLPPGQSVGQYVNQFSNAFAANPVLPIAKPSLSDPSQETIVLLLLFQVNGILNSGNTDLIDAVDALLAPSTNVSSLFSTTVNALFALPAISLPVFQLDVTADDLSLQGPLFREFLVSTTTGEILGASDYDVQLFSIEGGNWLSVSKLTVNGEPHIRLDFDTTLIETLDNGTYIARIDAYSTTDNFRSDGIEVRLRVAVVGPQIDAGPDIAADEKTSIVLEGFTNRPNDVETIDWVQLDGPPLVVEDVLRPTVELPAVDMTETATMRLDVGFVTGEMLSDTVTINILAALNIADVIIPDPVLQQCVDDAASAGNLVEAAELTSLTCPGVSDPTGLSAFVNLTSLDLSGSALTSLQQLIALSSLQFLDITGNSNFRCNEVDLLADQLIEGTDLLVDDTCQGTYRLDLAAIGFDAALDTPREQIYISLPSRNEVAVISTTELRIVDRIAVPGSPHGIDVSVDGTRLFAALNGSNSVAAIDLDQRTVSTIELGDSTGHPTTYDVIEAEQDRIFVSANPGSGGLARVAQVLLDPAPIASAVAGQTFIRSRPALTVSPDRQFVYVGSGFSPNSLYKLSLQDPDAGIVLEDDHGSVSGTDNLVLNSTGTRIALGSGQVLRTGSFIEEGRVTSGPSASSGTTLYVATGNGVLESFDFLSLQPGETMETGCNAAATSKLVVYNNDLSFMLLQADIACLPGPVSRSGGQQDPLAALRLPDLALEECVIDAASSQGFTTPEEFTSLDCSASARTILDLSGIDRFVNLTSLNISNSGVTNLSPIATLGLEIFSASSANLSSITPLLSMGSLLSANVNGNPSVLCTDLDQLVGAAVVVNADTCTDTLRIELGGIGHDLEYDAPNNRAFVSIPSLNRVSEIDLSTNSVTQTFGLSAQPRGIDFSGDGVTLYAALNATGDVVAIDTSSGGTSIIDVSADLGDDRTWDVAEVSLNRVVVSSNPSSNGIAYIVEVRRDLGNATARVASQNIIRAAPIFAVSADQTAVYVGEGFSPNSVYKLDATQADLPIVAEDDHGQINGSSSLALSPDGSRLYLLSGQVLSTDTITQVGQFPQGRSVVSADGTTLFVGDVDTDSARAYDTTTTGLTGTRPWGCDLQNLSTLVEFGDGLIAMGDDLLCYSRTVPYP